MATKKILEKKIKKVVTYEFFMNNKLMYLKNSLNNELFVFYFYKYFIYWYKIF